MTDQEKNPTPPIEDPAVDEDEMEIDISERKLLWTVVAVLAVFAVVEGLTIVSWGSRIRRLEVQVQASINGGEGGGAVHSGDPGRPPMDGSPREPSHVFPVTTAVSSPDEVRARTMRAVETFTSEQALDEATAEKLRTLIEDSERELESLPAREAAGEITAEERTATLEREIGLREERVRELLGDELGTELLARLSVGFGGGSMSRDATGGPPQKPPPHGD